MAPIADERLDQLAQVVSAAKVTPAAVRVVDIPGTGPQLLGNLRQVDALLAVVDGFSAGADPARRPRAARAGAARRRPRPRGAATRTRGEAGEVGRREAARRGGRAGAAACPRRRGRSLREWEGPLPPELEPLTTKPVVTVVNGPGGIDLKLEAELARASGRGGGRLPGRRVGTRRDRRGGCSRCSACHVLHRRREGGSWLDAAAWPVGARGGRDDPLRHRSRLHPLRGRALERPRRVRQLRGDGPTRASAARGEDV